MTRNACAAPSSARICAGARDLIGAQPPRRHEWPRCDRGREADKCHRATPPHIGKRCRRGRISHHVLRPMLIAVKRGRLHIGIMVAGHEAYVAGLPKRFEPMAGALELPGERDVHEVAGYRYMVRMLAAQIARDCREGIGTMNGAPAALPIDVAKQALRRQVGEFWPRHRAEMRVRQVRQNKGRAHAALYNGKRVKLAQNECGAPGEPETPPQPWRCGQHQDCVGKRISAVEKRNGRARIAQAAAPNKTEL